MKQSKLSLRLLSVLLTVAMLFTLLVPAVSAEPEADKAIEGEAPEVTELDPATLHVHKLGEIDEDTPATVEQEPYAVTDIVRVSIELEAPSTMDAGYAMDGVAQNTEAVAYREGLKAAQQAMQTKIETAIGKPIEVKWNLTLLMNVISANVRYGDLDAIRAIPGVKGVFLENQYEPPTDMGDDAQPNTANTSTFMVGAAETWAEGYTGAGSRVAIIDTGLDTTHQSVDADAFNYAIQQTGKTISLFTSSDLAAVKSQLNGSSGTYRTAKIPFGYNYVDNSTTITHLNDTQGEHGSHVAGIAAGNRFIKSGSSYVDAASTVHAVGMAPDAQLFIMKVFGANGGASDSDYMAAIEDAIVLGCDAVNLSLGSAVQGFTYTSSYQTVMNKLANASVNTKMVTSISAGNSFDFAYFLDTSTYARDLYIKDVHMHTGGSPGTFVNSLCVASADNTGITGAPLTFNGNQTVFYSETDSSGAKMTTVAGSYQYVYIDGVGNSAEYSAVGSSVLQGKIVIVNRGEISFYEKGNNLKSYNPKALIVANNTDGTINMALDDYTGTFPMVSITLADANTIKANSTAHTAGSYTYYTGTVQVSANEVSAELTDNAEMSVFSSWGAPGSLLMKPEITAPGGNIYSIAGTNKTSSGTAGGSDQYELMSGTSTAAPHITGLTGTLAQYIKENNITISGKTNRQIMQSLLMSTAVPMHIGSKTGPYYPILQQGSGLANVRQAVHASSVIFMNADATLSYADGKVKAEIGDKPGKSGSYSYSFTLYNTASQAQTYQLSTDLFTQDRYEQDGIAYMSKSTAALPWEVTYSTGNTVTVPAGSSKSVTVTISIPADMSAFDELYPSGAYVEGFTYVESQTTTSDGEKLDVRHSIPILGFYGSWTDPSMFDTLSYVDKNVYGDTRTNYSGVAATNYMTYKRSNSTKYVTGNPYTAEAPFPYEKLALRSTDTIYQIQYKLVRAAGTTGFAASKLDDAGNVTSVISASVSSTNVSGMYYNQSSSAWVNTSTSSYSVNKAVSTYGSEGEHFRVGWYAIPEYNAMQVASDKTAASAGYLTSSTFQTVLKNNVLGRGAMVGYDFFIDDTAPTILSAVKNGNTVTVQVRDNCYLAWLALVNAAGTTTYLGVVPEQTTKGETITYTFDVSGVSLPSGFKVLAGDYASNETTAEPTEPAFNVTAVSNNEAWGTVSVTGTTITASPAAGYYVESAEVLSGTATVTVNQNTIYVTATTDCTVRVNFAEKPQYTVSFVASGNAEGSQTAYVYDDVTLPASVSVVADGWTFSGWMTQQIDETTEKPTFYAPGAVYTVTGNVTLYAVYTRMEGSGEVYYQKLSAAPADWSGKYVITGGAGNLVLKGLSTDIRIESSTAGASILFENTGITLDGDVLRNVAPEYVFQVAPSNGAHYSIRNVATQYWIGTQATYLHNMESYQESYSDWDFAYDTTNACMKINNIGSTQYTYLVKGSNSYFVVNTGYTTNKTQLWQEVDDTTTYYWTDPVVAEHEHEMEYVAAVAPTCGAEGHSAYYRCTVCGKLFSDAAGENEITMESTVLPATGNHTFGAYVSNNDGTHKHVCSVCGAEEAENCTYTDVVTPPTATEQGYTTHTCEICGYSFVDSYTAPLGNDFPVHFSVPAGVTAPADMISNTNTGITLPTAEAPEGYTFLGWVTEDYDNVETRPATILNGTYIAPQEITLKALYTYTEGNSATAYELVSTAPADWTGNYVITYGTDTNMYLMKGVTVSSNGASIESTANAAAYAAAGVSLDGTTLTNVANDYVFAIAKQGSYYSIQNAATGTYVGEVSSTGYLGGYTTYNSTTCDWTPGTLTGASSMAFAHYTSSSNYYPYVGFAPSYQYFWSASSSNTTRTSIRFWQETQAGTAYYTTIIGEPAHEHTPAEPVIENNVDPTCTEAGSYDSVVYCAECGEEISRETVTVPATGHSYSGPVWTWNAELTAATAKFTCANCGDVQTLDAVITESVITEAKPHVAGEKKLTATVTFEGTDYTDEKTVEIEALPCPCAKFDDMPAYGTPEHEAIDWAFTKGITVGLSATEFGTNKTLTRAQTAAFLYAAAGKPEVDSTASLRFTDVVPKNWYYTPVLWAASNNLVAGYENNTFRPNNTLTRAQILTILYAWVDKPSVDEYTNPYTDVVADNWYYAPAVWAYYAGIEKGENRKFAQGTPCTRAAFVLYLYRHLTGNCLLED